MKRVPTIILALAFTGLAGSAFAQAPPVLPEPAVPQAAAVPASGGVADPFVKEKTQLVSPADPFSTPAASVSEWPKEGLLMMEVFSLPHTLGRKAMRQNPTQSGLYAWLDKQLDKADTEVALEHLSVLRVRSGQRSKVEEIVEYPRPTEFDPPHIPQYYSPTPPTIPPAPPTPAPTPNPTPTPTPAPMPAPAPAPTPAGAHGEVGTCGPECSPGSKSPSKPWPYTPTTPTSFEIRNIGWTTEAELNINDDGKTADLNIAPEFSKLIARLPIGINEEIILPVFETQKLAAQIFATVGKPTLIGSMNPPIGTGVNGSNDDNRVWFLYVTVIQPE